MWDRLDNQEVGSEAATLERVRNSSLVKWSCADNVVGLKYTAEAAIKTKKKDPSKKTRKQTSTPNGGQVQKKLAFNKINTLLSSQTTCPLSDQKTLFSTL